MNTIGPDPGFGIVVLPGARVTGPSHPVSFTKGPYPVVAAPRPEVNIINTIAMETGFLVLIKFNPCRYVPLRGLV
jgi:hypothetical protein